MLNFNKEASVVIAAEPFTFPTLNLDVLPCLSICLAFEALHEIRLSITF